MSKPRTTSAAGLRRTQQQPELLSPQPFPELFPVPDPLRSGGGGPEPLQRQMRRSAITCLRNKIKSKWSYLTTQKAFRRSPITTVIRLTAWRIRCLFHWDTTIDFTKWNLQLFLPADWKGIAKLAFAFRQYYEPELEYLERLLSPGKTFVDAGACYGIYTLVASKLVGTTGRVMAFEPATRAFPVLRRNIELNRVTNVLAYPLALTEKESKAWLYRHPNIGCDSLGKDQSFTESPEEVATGRLDDVLRRAAVRKVDVMKLDVQGAEELVLRGALATLQEQHPAVIFEVYPEGTAPLGLAPDGAWQLLASLGYHFFTVDQDGALTWEQSPPANRNVVALYSGSPTNVLPQ